MIDVAGNLARVCARIEEAARDAGRDPAGVQLVAVSKKKPPEMIRAAVDAGARVIGESYLQEAQAKIPEVRRDVAWHFIGHLQRNKARKAVDLFEMIQTLDTLQLAQALDRLGRERGKPVRALIEVNTGGEASKSGAAPDEMRDLIRSLAPLDGLSVEGLMTLPPPQPSAEAVRPFFRLLRLLRDDLRRDAPPNVDLRELSMGMTDDFPVAIAEGATIVRVGRAIFGERT